MLCCFMLVLVLLSFGVWLASIKVMMTWFLFCKSLITLPRAFIASLQGYVVTGRILFCFMAPFSMSVICWAHTVLGLMF